MMGFGGPHQYPDKVGRNEIGYTTGVVSKQPKTCPKPKNLKTQPKSGFYFKNRFFIARFSSFQVSKPKNLKTFKKLFLTKPPHTHVLPCRLELVVSRCRTETLCFHCVKVQICQKCQYQSHAATVLRCPNDALSFHGGTVLRSRSDVFTVSRCQGVKV